MRENKAEKMGEKIREKIWGHFENFVEIRARNQGALLKCENAS